MKKEKIIYLITLVILLVFLFATVEAKAQAFIVEKISGKVLVLKGTSEDYQLVKKGDILSPSDLLITEENSVIHLSKNSKRFILNSNSALGLNYIKEVSLNDLLLALTMEEVRNIPDDRTSGSKSTAVYGTKENSQQFPEIIENSLGLKRINGARQLAESGYKESAVIAVKETYRKYPSTKLLFNDRLYFADLLKELGLMREALSEYNDIAVNQLNEHQTATIQSRIEDVSLVIANED